MPSKLEDPQWRDVAETTNLTPAEMGRRGGRAAAAALTPDQRRERSRKGAAAVNSPEGLATRLVAKWSTLTSDQRTHIRATLSAILVDSDE